MVSSKDWEVRPLGPGALDNRDDRGRSSSTSLQLSDLRGLGGNPVFQSLVLSAGFDELLVSLIWFLISGEYDGSNIVELGYKVLASLDLLYSGVLIDLYAVEVTEELRGVLLDEVL